MAAMPPSGSQETSSAPPLPPLSWEGEKMFNIYIYDYCFKRGFRKTARELLVEAEISPESTPPINARQGLLYEWWSVFWLLFQAKAHQQGSEEALLYTQHVYQRQDQLQRNRLVAGAPSNAVQQQQRQANPTAMPNGMVPNPGAVYSQPQPPPGLSPMTFSMGGAPGPQVNGVPGSHPPTPGTAPPQGQIPQGPHPGGPQQPGFNPMMQPQRPLNGQPPQPPQAGGPSQPQQQRPMAGPNPNLPFQSPTMAANSPNAGAGMPPPPAPTGPQQPPMANLGGPSPLMVNRPGGMMPPNGVPPPQGMMMQPGGPMQNGNPSQPFQQVGNNGRPPSRTNTPQASGMIQQSPSMASRQLMTDSVVATEFTRIPHTIVAQLKSECELSGKDINQFTIQDKRRILQLHQARNRPANAAAGPSNPPRGPQPQQQPQQKASGKRPSTSPGEEHETLPRNESSPPERKRPRRSPADSSVIPKPMNSFPQTPQQAPALPPQGQPPPPNHPGGLQQQGAPAPNFQPGMMMMGGRPMGPQGTPMQGPMMVNGHIPPPPMMQGQPMQGMSPQNPMGPPGHMGMMMNQMGQNYRVPLHQVHNAPGIMQQQPQNAGSPAGHDPGFNQGGPGQGPQFNTNRLLGQKPGGPTGNMMPPPPSPANANKDPKDGKTPDGTSGQQQNQQAGQSGPLNSGPPQSNPTGAAPPGTPQQGQQQQATSGPPSQNPAGGPASSPSNLMGGPGGVPNAMGSLTNPLVGLDNTSMDNIFGGEFMDFDTQFDGVDFARDFGQWFNPAEDVTLGMEGAK